MKSFAFVLLASLAIASTSILAKGNVAEGEKKSKPCQACHGENGVSKSGDFPTIAGQHEDYLTYSLRMYRKASKGDKSGRTNAIMTGQAATLSDKDIADLAAYYARQKSGLSLKY
jgi:cytochrome c553